MAAHKIAGERVLLLEQSTPWLSLDRESADKKVSPSQRAKYIAVNVFLVFHLLAIACWCVPIDSPLIPLCRNLVRPYFLWAGLFQSWDMFAPVPKGANTYIEAVLIYRDGVRKTWTLPRMEQVFQGTLPQVC